MQPARNQARAPGSFAPLPPISSNASNVDLSSSSRPRPRRVESASSDESFATPALNLQKARSSPQPPYGSFTQLPNASNPSLQNFSRPTLHSSNSNTAVAAAAAARQVAGSSSSTSRSGSPLTLPEGRIRAHSRKHSQTAGLFDSTLPSTSVSNLSQIGMAAQGPPVHQHRELSASQIAAQAAVMQHQSQQQQHQPLQQQQHLQQQHARQRSQTVPAPGEPYDNLPPSNKRGSGGPLSPPMLSLTEASAPRDHGFGNQGGYHNGLLGNQRTAAQAAASVAFPRSGQSSPGLPSQIQIPTPPPPPPPLPEKKPEKSKVKLFSRPGKIGTKGEPKEKPLPSPSKIGSALASLQRGNFSTTSLDSSAQSFYSLGNSSSATIRAVDTPPTEGKEKEKKHHFLSRQKHKLKDKDDYHLPLSSASSNSRPTDPHAPSSLYNFNLPPSPGPSTTFKSVSGLDLRHGGRALREQKREEKAKAAESTTTLQTEFGPSSLTSSAGQSSVFLSESLDSGKTGLNNMSMDDAWPFLKAKLLVVFQGEDLRLPVEDFNRVVMVHIQYCIQRRSPNIIIDDLRDLLSTGFSSLDQTLRKTPEDKLIPSLVELWLFTFTSILPYMQAVFLPLDLEFQGVGPLLTADKARDFWGGAVAPSATDPSRPFANIAPVAAILDVRRLVLTAYRDTVIMPRFEKLKTMFSRLSLEFLPGSGSFSAGTPGASGGPLAASPIPIQSQQDLFSAAASAHYFSTSPSGDSTGSYPLRPGTAMSLDPSVASYNSNSTTLLGDGSAGGSRSRAISNVSFGSGASDPRPFTPGGGMPQSSALGGGLAGLSGTTLRELQNVDDGKAVTDMVGRMLQCMSVLASVGVAGNGSDEGTKAVEELSRLLKLNWLGRGRTGRNRRGIVGGRVRRVGTEQPVREEVSVV